VAFRSWASRLAARGIAASGSGRGGGEAITRAGGEKQPPPVNDNSRGGILTGRGERGPKNSQTEAEETEGKAWSNPSSQERGGQSITDVKHLEIFSRSERPNSPKTLAGKARWGSHETRSRGHMGEKAAAVVDRRNTGTR